MSCHWKQTLELASPPKSLPPLRYFAEVGACEFGMWMRAPQAPRTVPSALMTHFQCSQCPCKLRQ